MDDRLESRATYPKTGACACGALKVTATAPPWKVHVCACLDCQRKSGSAFSYSAFFAEAAIAISGPFKVWRRIAGSGRWINSYFCPDCGGSVFIRMEAFPDVIGVAVGCFADPGFEPPAAAYWTTRQHVWFVAPPGLIAVETQ